MTGQIITALIILCICLAVDRIRSTSYRGRRRRIPGGHRHAAGERNRRLLLTGMHRPDMYGKAPR